MLKTIKCIEETVIKGQSLEEKISNINPSNVFHIMWLYKNIENIYIHCQNKFDSILKIIDDCKINDFGPANAIAEDISLLIHKMYKIKSWDDELTYILEKCNFSNLEFEDNQLEGLKKYILRFCKPIVYVCTKEVVDIMAFVYELDRCEDFDGLFEFFKNRPDILIELNLHKVRILRKKCKEEAKFRKVSVVEKKEDINRSIIEDINENISEKEATYENFNDTNNDIPFINNSPKNGTDESDDGGKRNNLKDLNEKLDELTLSHTQENEEISKKRPFTTEIDERLYLDRAKKYLCNFDNPSLNFYIENLSLYLSLDYDEEIFERFLKYTNGGYKYVCARNIYRLKSVPQDKVIDLLQNLEGVDKEILKSKDMEPNVYTLKKYVDWCLFSFKSISIALVSDYVDISKIYLTFIRKYKHSSMFYIFRFLMNCNVFKVESDIKIHLLSNFSEIIETFITDCDKSEELLENREVKEYLTDKREDSGLSSIYISENSKINEKCDVTDKYTKLYTFEEIEQFKKLEGSMNDNVDIIISIKQIINDIIEDTKYRKYFIEHIGILEHFDLDFRKGIIKKLFIRPVRDWRYKKLLLENCFKNSKKIGLNTNKWIDNFLNDKAFIIRELAKDFKGKMTPESN